MLKIMVVKLPAAFVLLNCTEKTTRRSNLTSQKNSQVTKHNALMDHMTSLLVKWNHQNRRSYRNNYMENTQD